MKRQSILFILSLLLILATLCGCSSTKSTKKESADQEPMEVSLEETSEDALVEEASESDNIVTEDLVIKVEDTVFEGVTGIFEGLEDNHTALFSFDGVEIVFFFEDPEVQTILSEAVIGSSYTLSYHFDSAQGINILLKISE